MNFGHTRGIGQNSIFNLLTQVVVSVVAFLAIPFIIRRLGTEQYGLLSLLWLLVGYFGILDAGISQSSTKYISEELGRNDKEAAAGVARSSFFLAGAVGVFTGLVIYLLSFAGFERLVSIPEAMRADADACIRLVALSLPFVVIQGTLKSIPVAFSRFDVVNVVQGLGGLLQWGGAVLILMAGGGIVTLIAWTVVVRAGTCTWYFVAGSRLMPEFRHVQSSGRAARFLPLLKYGGWVTVPQIVTPVMVLMERLFVSSVLTLSWLSFYVVPYDALTKLLVIPMSLVSTLFPYMSSQWQQEQARSQVAVVYLRAVKFLGVIMLPIVLMLAVFGKDILRLWLSAEFAEKSQWVFVFCIAGTMLNSLAQIPSTALYAMGKPEISAKLLLLEFPFYILLCWQLTVHYGIVGTAVGWFGRIFFETAVLFIYASKTMGRFPSADFLSGARRNVMATFLFIGLILSLQVFSSSLALRVSGSLVLLLIYAVFSWSRVFDENDRAVVRRLLPEGSAGNSLKGL